MRYLLFYDYVPDVADRRPPLRTEHLGLLQQLNAAGQLIMAGAYTDPLDGALLVFADRESAEQFVAVDPYVAGGLVAGHHIREWNVVVGG
ncbi:MAG: YciI family protein [Tepidiformaceae bacterium]